MSDACRHCRKPPATMADDDLRHNIERFGDVRPLDWPDDEGGHLCWGGCTPAEPVACAHALLPLVDGVFDVSAYLEGA